VAVLEADRIAAGVTGYTTAKLSALHTTAYSTIRTSVGPDAARLYAQSQQHAAEHVAALAARLDIACDLERLPAFTYVESPERVDEMRAEADAAAEAGLAASFVTETGLPFPVAGAVRVQDQAQFHPRKSPATWSATGPPLARRLGRRRRGRYGRGPSGGRRTMCRLPRRCGKRARRLGALHPPRLHRELQRCRDRMGMPLPR
jgi:hypothetical protein